MGVPIIAIVYGKDAEALTPDTRVRIPLAVPYLAEPCRHSQ